MIQTKSAWWFVFCEDQLLLEKKGDTFTVPCQEAIPVALDKGATIHEITTMDGIPCKAFDIEKPIDETDKYRMMGLRASHDFIPFQQYDTAGKAAEIMHWDRNSHFCAACGTPMEQKEPIMKKCPACGREVYPAISAAVLVLIRKGNEILLVHARNFKGTFNSLVAGFLETGETLEECAIREVKEETGLDIKNITYFANQVWPYPSGLMVGFIADYAGGEIQLQEEELSFGAFYTKDNLPELPRKLSLARKMIDWWIANQP